MKYTGTAQTAAPEQAANGVTEGSEHLLVVEDDQTVREFLRMTLEKIGYRVTTAEDGLQGLQALEGDGGIDLIVSDVLMPNLDGVEMFRRMRPLKPSLKIIFVSGYSGDILTAEDVSGSCAAFIQKPVLRETLLAVIREMLDGCRAPAQSPEGRGEGFSPAA